MLKGSWTLISTHRDCYDGNSTTVITENEYRCSEGGSHGRHAEKI